MITKNIAMTVTYLTLFSLRSLLALDILAWIVGVLLIAGAVALLYFQYRQYRTLQSELAQLAKAQVHTVEYDMVLKAMRLAIFRVDLKELTFMVETDYRDVNDGNYYQPGTPLEAIYKHMLPEYVGNIRQALTDLIAGRTDEAHAQFQMWKPDRSGTYWAEAFGTVDKRDLQGSPVSLVGTLMRIDQQKDIEEALMDAVYHAEESDRLKSAFLANISHEIRTPLNAIVGFSDVLPMVDDEEERQKLIGLIKQNNAHLLRLFDDVVNMSKLEARGGDAIKTSTFPLDDVFTELADRYRIPAEEKGLVVQVVDADRLPTLTTDRERLREILNQYLDNALKFTSQGQVTLGCHAVGDQWRIWVRDTGKGIPAEKCNERLFERFVKVDEFVPGMGLGLSICRNMALTLGGTVGVASTPGEGSVFWVELPQE